LEGVDYLEHAIVQLYPQNPFKTQNCVSLSVSFAVPPSLKEGIVERFKDAIGERTFSKETAMAYFNGVMIKEELMAFSKRAKLEMVTVEDAEEAAEMAGVSTIKITGARGLIGAVAAIPYVEYPDEAVRISGDQVV